MKFCGAINVSSKKLTSIKELTDKICHETNYQGQIKYDSTKLSGQNQRIMDTSKMDKIGWSPKINLSDGIKKTIRWFIENRLSIREK